MVIGTLAPSKKGGPLSYHSRSASHHIRSNHSSKRGLRGLMNQRRSRHYKL